MSETFVAPPNWTPPAVRPPLTARQKSGSRLAGIFGFLLLSIGFGLFAFPLVVLAFSALFSFVVQFVRRVSHNDARFEQFVNGMQALNPSAWVLPLVIASVVGLALMAGALLLSARILRSHDVARPWAVTWAGAGVAIVGSWVVSGIVSFPLGLTGGMRGDDNAGAIGLGIGVGIVSALVGLATTVVVGWLSWWWMAHALRAPLNESQINSTL